MEKSKNIAKNRKKSQNYSDFEWGKNKNYSYFEAKIGDFEAKNSKIIVILKLEKAFLLRF